jgi:hypothetical protein
MGSRLNILTIARRCWQLRPLVHCREGYQDADGVLTHLQNVGALLVEALKISELTRLEIHGPKEELAKLREPLAHLKPQFFVLEYGFRRQI